MKTLGVVMIVKNESVNIRDCLMSVQGADEIVVVDTGSDDNTIDLCEALGATVYEDKWRDDFSYSRNVAFKKSTADYMLVIDADEILRTPIKQIKKLINEYWFRKYFGAFFTIQMKFEIFESPRLFKNVPEIYYINPAHNVPTWRGDADELVKRLYRSNFTIESGYSEAHKLDPDRTFRILTKNYEKKPEDSRTIYYLAREYLNRKDVKEATKLFEKYKRLKFDQVDLWDNELADVLYLLALCYSDKEAWNEVRWFDAVDTAMWSFCILPNSKDCANLLSSLFGEMPGSVDQSVRKQVHTEKFWAKVRDEATDAGVLMKRQC
jgi:glycosyltransferase involved in cell wall biosynthesis